MLSTNVTLFGGSDDIIVHVWPVDGQAGSLAGFCGPLMHKEQVTKNVGTDRLRNHHSRADDDHFVGFVDGQTLFHASVRS